MSFKYILHSNAVLHNMSTRSLPVPMEHDPARFKLNLVDLSHGNRLLALVTADTGTFSYYFKTYGKNNMNRVVLVIPSSRGGREDNKEGHICLGRGGKANVFIVSGQGVLPVYGIQGEVENFLDINTGLSKFQSEGLGSQTSAGDIGYSDMIFKGKDSTEFTVKNLYYGPR